MKQKDINIFVAFLSVSQPTAACFFLFLFFWLINYFFSKSLKIFLYILLAESTMFLYSWWACGLFIIQKII